MAYAHLDTVKSMIGVTGTYQDAALNGYASEVIEYLEAAGVDRDYAESDKCIGVVARGISDLWNLGSGGASLSPYFKERVIQLAYRVPASGGGGDDDTEVVPITPEEIDEVIEDIEGE